MPVKFQALLLLALISLGLMALGLLTGGSVEQVLVVPLVLIVPGLAITAALFQRNGLGPVEQTLLSLGLSMALIIVGGIALDWTPWGLQTFSWVLLLGAVTLVAGVIAFFRFRVGRTGGGSLAGPDKFNFHLDRSLIRPLVLFILAGIIVVIALSVARYSALNQTTPGFTQLWLLPGEKVASGVQLKVGFNNQEDAALTYRLQVKDASKVLQEWPAITLKPGGQWETTFTLPLGLPSGEKIDAFLYLATSPDKVYRQVSYYVA